MGYAQLSLRFSPLGSASPNQRWFTSIAIAVLALGIRAKHGDLFGLPIF
jgi:hypothetical protein